METQIDDDPNSLPDLDREAMFELMVRHYDNVHREVFERDLAEKRWVIRLFDSESRKLCGFSTQRLLEATIDGDEVLALFSGDTIVDREHWGSPMLAIAWGQLAVHLIELHTGKNLYWFLICKGFRTYRFLSVFFREFYPRFDVSTPIREKRIMDRFAMMKFHDHYDSQRGIVRAESTTYKVRSEIDQREQPRRDRHVEYFFERNPGYIDGDELCCLTPLTIDNFTPAARRLMASSAFQRKAIG